MENFYFRDGEREREREEDKEEVEEEGGTTEGSLIISSPVSAALRACKLLDGRQPV